MRSGTSTRPQVKTRVRGRIARVALVFLAAAGLTVGTAIPANATYFASGFGAGFFYVNDYSYNTTYQPAMDQAIVNWNNAAAPVDIQKIAGGNTVTAASYAETWYGYYTRQTTSFTIQLNSRVISSSCTNVSNCITSVFVHELGHALYLDDNPPVASSIMLSSRNRNVMTTPSAYDESEATQYNTPGRRER